MLWRDSYYCNEYDGIVWPPIFVFTCFTCSYNCIQLLYPIVLLFISCRMYCLMSIHCYQVRQLMPLN